MVEEKNDATVVRDWELEWKRRNEEDGLELMMEEESQPRSRMRKAATTPESLALKRYVSSSPVPCSFSAPSV